jgi:nicotinamidase-related amidase
MAGQAKIDTPHTALVLMDFQPAILGSLEDAAEALRHAGDALCWARRRGIRTAYVRVAFTESELDALPGENKTFGPLKGLRVLVDGTPECEVIEPLRPNPDDIVVRKTRFGSFSTTNLERQLQDAGIRTLVLAGVSTSGVVLSTVREAADRDFALVVLGDACADPDPELHEILIRKAFSGQADVIPTAELESLA